MKDLDVLTRKEQNGLFNLDQALSKFDQLFFYIQSTINDLIPCIEQTHCKDSADRLRDLSLRLERLYHCLIEGEMAILELAMTYYRVNFGPFREKPETKAFDQTGGGRQTIACATSLFYAFTVEYGSILDLGLKLMLMLTGQELPSQVTSIEGYGRFVKIVRNDEQLRIKLEKHPLIGHWLKYEQLMTSMKNRRDLFIHHLYMSTIIVSERTPLGYIELSFWSPEIHRYSRSSFDVIKDRSLRYNYYCRASFYALLNVINDNLSKLLAASTDGKNPIRNKDISLQDEEEMEKS